MPGKSESLLNLNRRLLLIAWLALGLIVLIASQGCSAIWAFGNRCPHHWDNALYVNRAWVDLWSYTNGGPTNHQPGLRGVWDSLINADHYAPPAYRMVTLPVIFWGARMLAVLRAVSLLVFWLTLYTLYRTGTLAIDGHPGRAAGIISAMLVGMYIEVGSSIRVYGTEFTLYFATTLVLYCLVRATREVANPHLTWIGLGFALGLGMLSKVSFPLLAGPPVLIATALVVMRRLSGLSIWKLLASATIALVMALPFYSRHGSDALYYAQDMTKFTRHSLHRRGWELLRLWAQLHIREGIGIHGASIAGLLISAAILSAIGRLLWNRLSHRQAGSEGTPEGPDRASNTSGLSRVPIAQPWKPVTLAIAFALSQALVLPIYQLIFSQSNNVRHITPAYLPLTMAIALFAANVGAMLDWQGWAVLVLSGWMAFSQLVHVDVSLTTTVDDVWDWAPLYSIVESKKIQFPMIAHVGNTPQYCGPFLTEPWISRGRFADDIWLWRPENGPFNLAEVKSKLTDRNVVITAPDLQVPANGSLLGDPIQLDNPHNTEFAQAMLNDPAWELAGKFKIGLINHAEIWVFVRHQ